MVRAEPQDGRSVAVCQLTTRPDLRIALVKDDDGKDLYDRATESIDKLIKIDPVKWRDRPALDLMKSHYLRVNGKMVPAC